MAVVASTAAASADTAHHAATAVTAATPAAATEDAPDQLPDEVDDLTHYSGVKLSIENIVATAYLNVSTKTINLQSLANTARNTEYTPRRFAPCILRIREPRSTALVYASGKVVIMGAKSEDDAKLAAEKFTTIIKKAKIKVSLVECKIHNVVACADVKFKINLNKLHIEHNRYCRYDPEVFPGLTYRMKVPDVVLLIFHSGKVVLTKAKTRIDVRKAFNNIYPVLTMHRSDN